MVNFTALLLRSCSKIRHVKCSEMYLNANRNHSRQKPVRRREDGDNNYVPEEYKENFDVSSEGTSTCIVSIVVFPYKYN